MALLFDAIVEFFLFIEDWALFIEDRALHTEDMALLRQYALPHHCTGFQASLRYASFFDEIMALLFDAIAAFFLFIKDRALLRQSARPQHYTGFQAPFWYTSC